jgi:hypothetical protein
MAYCLLGIFNIYMPLIYGEGWGAFTRLQEEIIKDKHDLSIFAWKAEPNGQEYRGLLARSPSEFRSCQDTQLSYHLKMTTDYSITNRGVRLHTLLGTDEVGNYVLPLGCTVRDEVTKDSKKRGMLEDKDSVGVYLKIAPKYGLVRARPGELHTYQGWTSSMISRHGRKLFHIPQDLSLLDCLIVDEQHYLNIHLGKSNFPFEVINAGPAYSWDVNSRMFITMADRRFTGYCRLRITTSRRSSFECILVCGLMQIPSIESNSIQANSEGLHVRTWCSVFSSASPMWTELCDLTKGHEDEAQDLLHLRNTVDKKFGKSESDRCISETTSDIVLVSVSTKKEYCDSFWSSRINISLDYMPRRYQQ